MLPISPSAERPVSVSASTPSMRADRAGVVRRERAAAGAVEVADDAGRRRRPHAVLGLAGGLDRLGDRQRERAGDGDVDGAAEQRRQRRAGGAGADVRQLAQGVELQVGVRVSWRVESFRRAQAAAGRGVGHEGIAVDDQGDLAVGEDGGAGDGRRRSATSAGSGRVTSSRWPTSAATAQRDAALAGRCTMTAYSPSRRARAAERRGRVEIGRTPSVERRASAAGGRTARGGRRGGRCARCGRAGSRTAGRRPRRAARAMIASVSGRRICAVRAPPGSEVSRTSPPSSRTLARTASIPTPRPEMSSVTSAVEKPGREEELDRAAPCRSRRPARA